MKSTTSFIAALAVIIIVVTALATTTSRKKEGTYFKDTFLTQERGPFLTKEFTLDGPGNLRVRTSGGGIAVSSRAGNAVKVEMYVRKRGKWVVPGDAAQEQLSENYTIDISKSGNSVSAIVERKNKMERWFSGDDLNISFTVYVPENMSCNLHTSGGSIKLEGVNGKQEVKTSGGSLALNRIKGDMEAGTSGGNIDLEKYAGTLYAHTSGGSIRLRDAQGEIKVNTSGGSIRMENIAGSIEASTSGGGIRADMLTLDKYLRLKTSGGSITATIPRGLGLDLDLKGGRVNAKLSNFSGEAEKNKIRGRMNGGGIPVVMYTSGGSVNIEYQ